MQVQQTETSETDKHSHEQTRVNLQVCSNCGRFIATTYEETDTGELVIKELELDVKIVSSRISQLRSTVSQTYSSPKQSSDKVMTKEETCW